ncbi:DUF4291 domain-containing protein [Rhodocytophaga rosea]|uniref:DUF4291 domain-containing protein n=1 Tax=Rhodocytophaga rosea TaxID=2704465 RepID=A0A6C0GCG6_9BACT|nr:DUF4291 domain-containing protein [Rhodocytophaga rosea]QHT65544.1 DUF4291 domain-containing protein [Rhodocytophaga rosea]
MELVKEKYSTYKERLPRTGKQIIGQFDQQWIVVYQAFNPLITNYAVKHQKFGGDHYSFNRMSWIKPNFLWMMYRAGWASKPNQERILAIWVDREKFEYILSLAVPSSYNRDNYSSNEQWKQALDQSEVRLQWDPDHDPYGIPTERRAVQLGLKGEVLYQFCTQWLGQIQDITEWVKLEGEKVFHHQIDSLMVAREEVYPIENLQIVQQIGL